MLFCIDNITSSDYKCHAFEFDIFSEHQVICTLESHDNMNLLNLNWCSTVQYYKSEGPVSPQTPLANENDTVSMVISSPLTSLALLMMSVFSF